MEKHIHPSLSEDFASRDAFLKGHEPQKNLAKLIDSTLLKTTATVSEFMKLFADAVEYQVKSVCIPPYYVPLAKKNCGNILICTVVGFPNGYSTTYNKALETQEAVAEGATEIDFVNNLSLVKSQLWQELEFEYKKIVEAAQGNVTKLILETCLLSDAEIEQCCKIAKASGVHIIKTSTGFAERGANEHDMHLIKFSLEKIYGPEPLLMGTKASGGIRSYEDAVKMIQLGATRIGTSQATKILSSHGSVAE